MNATQIKAIRKSLGWTTARLAYALGVSSRTIEDWEQERTECSGPAARLLEILATSTGTKGELPPFDD